MKDWVTFMMRFELGLDEPEPSRVWKSALTIAGSSIVGRSAMLRGRLFSVVTRLSI